MAKKKLFSVQRQTPRGVWATLVGFMWIPRGEAEGALGMADAHYGTPRYRIIHDDPQTGPGEVVREGGGRSTPNVGRVQRGR